MSVAASETWRHTIRYRLAVVAVVAAAWVLVIEGRLAYLQLVRHADYVARAERQQMRTLEIPAKRGDIVDRNGRVLAYSVDADSIYAVPSEIKDASRMVTQLCRALDDCDRELRATLAERFADVPADEPGARPRRRAFAWVQRQASPDEARRVEALDLEGIGFVKESRRFYPNMSIAGPVLGYVGLDDKGLGGVESAYDSVIRGKPGRALVQIDAKRHGFSRTEQPPTSGANVELTLDTVLQWIAERELKAGIKEHGAKGGTVIVMDPWTGDILAMATQPTFNPNAFASADPASLHNQAVESIYEPGSTFKIVTASAALEEGVIRPTDVINVAPGRITIGSRTVRDTHEYGDLTFMDVVVKSSNVGAIKVGFMLGPERLSRYVRRFGFGSRTDVGLSGESPGIVWSQLSDSALASVSMGYQVGVTPLQMVTAASSVANGGQLMQPRLVRAITDAHGRTEIPPRLLRRTISEKTAATLTAIMEEVVNRGTAKAAQIEGYRIAGKTGTAAKLVDGAYSRSDYMASFVGFLPSRNPAIAMLVVIDSPSRGSHFGGLVAAPIFKRIAEAAIRRLGLPRSVDPLPPVLVDRRSAPPAVPVSGPAIPELVPRASGPGELPDLRGLSARDASRTVLELGLRPRIHGDGIVTAQRPAPGTSVDAATGCDLWLERMEPADAVPEQADITSVEETRP
jgi:cell division protein FtsI (penicillin-binding protein 3)